MADLKKLNCEEVNRTAFEEGKKVAAQHEETFRKMTILFSRDIDFGRHSYLIPQLIAGWYPPDNDFRYCSSFASVLLAPGMYSNVTIKINTNQFPSRTDPDVGDYHRMIVPGTYSFEFTATGYLPQTIDDVVISGGPATILDVALERLRVELQPVASIVEDGPTGNRFLDPGESTPAVHAG